jgi:CBS domain-containing membrane protein
MSLTRCLHPPGGAAAMTVVLGGSTVTSAGDLFPLAPLGLDAVALVLVGWVFHRFSGHSYPHVTPAPASAVPATTDPPPSRRVGFRGEDVDGALLALGESYDISRGDLRRLLEEVEARALVREHGDLTCGEIMSRDVLSVGRDDAPDAARRVLLESGVRLLPVLTSDRRVVGAVGLRELARPGVVVGDVMTPPLTTAPDRPAIALTEPLTDGHHHAAMVLGPDGRLVGLISQADLLAAITRRLDRV